MLDGNDIEDAESNEPIEVDTGDATDTVDYSDSKENDGSNPVETQEAKPATLTPFAQGKEKFKINGEELEWDWETTKRYAQLGRSGQIAMERAAQVEQKAKTAYQQILKAAQNDPEGLLEVLNPNYKRQSTAAQRDESVAQDPRDAKIRYLEEQVQKFSGHLESQEVEQARKEIDSELEAASKKFPSISGKVYQEYVKAQYRKYLNQGISDISIEDIAFSVHQENLEEQRKREGQKKASLDQKRKMAPAHSVGGSIGSSDRREGETGLEYAMRLAGRTG